MLDGAARGTLPPGTTAESLGGLYEQHLARAEPGSRRARGAFYTPEYIVDFVVRETVGPRWREQLAARPAGEPPGSLPLTVLDPACGGGIFLIRAYQYLLDRYRDWYLARGIGTAGDALQRDAAGQWQLALSARKQILLEHLFGVDLDSSAVAVTRQALLMKCLECRGGAALEAGESEELLARLAANIHAGNALVGTVERDAPQGGSAFRWHSAFPSVLTAGGFDVVLGNPPYVKEYTDLPAFRALKQTSLARYYQGKMDLWYAFACLAIDLLREGGWHSFLATNNWTTNSGARRLREKVRSECELRQIVDFGPWQVFDSASIQTMVYVLRKPAGGQPAAAQSVPYVRLTDARAAEAEVRAVLGGDGGATELPRGPASPGALQQFYARVSAEAGEEPLTFVDPRCQVVLDKLATVGRARLQAEEIAQGIVPNPDVVTARSLKLLPATRVEQLELRVGDPVFVGPRGFLGPLSEFEAGFVRPTYEPAELQRFRLPLRHERELIYLTRANDPGALPVIETHLSRYREIMQQRRETQLGRIEYKHLHWPRDERFFAGGPKILCVRKCRRPVCVYTDQPAYVMMAINVIRCIAFDPRVLTVWLNSRLVHFWLDQQGKKQGSQLQVDKEPLTRIPLLLPESMASLGRGRLLEIARQLTARTAPQDAALLERQADELIYAACGLHTAEIELVEQVLGVTAPGV